MKYIFSEEITYSAQIEKLIELIYTHGRGNSYGPSAIAKLFGITKGVIRSHISDIGRSFMQ